MRQRGKFEVRIVFLTVITAVMPLKWKLYYWCAMYYLLAIISAIGLGVYMMVSDTDQSYRGYWVLVIIALMTAKPILSFKSISHLKRETYYTKNEFILFSVFFIANIVFTFYAGVTAVLALMQIHASQLADIYGFILIGLLLFVISSVYLISLDTRLRKLIQLLWRARLTKKNA